MRHDWSIFTLESPSTFHHFLQLLPHWESDLLLPPPSDNLPDLELAPTYEFLLLCTDGGALAHKKTGSYGWVLAQPNASIFVEHQGHVPGGQVDSFRAEAVSLLSALRYLNAVTSFYGYTFPFIKHLTDCQLLQTILTDQPKIRSTQVLSPSWDVLQTIQESIQDMQLHITHEAIPSHPEQTKQHFKFTIYDNLIFRADELAGRALNTAPFAPITPFLPASHADFTMQATITQNIANSVRSNYTLNPLARYWQRKLVFPVYMTPDVDMDLLQHICTMSKINSRFIT